MRRNNTFRTVLIVAAILWAVYQLYPTFVVGNLKDEAAAHRDKIVELTGIQIDEINEALARGILENRLRQAMQGENSAKLDEALAEAQALIELDDEIAEKEPKAIKRGLDLQGGSYLVFEADLPKLARNLAKNKDKRFDEIMREVEAAAAQPNVDFFDALQEHFAAAGVRLSRYFGSRAQTDAQIIENLKNDADDSINRNLEILRNRIDQFGVSEPSITKQGDRRIVVELAGITDVGRAKNIIGKTALLEFQLLKEFDVMDEVFNKIDQVLRSDLNNEPEETVTQIDSTTTDTSAADTSAVESIVRKDDEMSVDELFGSSSIVEASGSTETDSTLLVQKDIFDEKPFRSLITGLPNRSDIYVSAENHRIVERIINSPEVIHALPADVEFAWGSEPEQQADKLYYPIYLLKKEAELTGTYLADARATISSGYGLTRQGEWEVNLELDSEGGKIFSRVTGANVNKRLAIVLDGKVIMAPNIDEKIPNGRAVIRGNMQSDDAQDLAIVLRAGALQAPMKIIEERTVGPSLGQDSISKGQYSALIGFTIVVLFIVVYYKLSGLIANVALLLNILLVMAALALVNATLTLPGVAGIILTIGIAVDANVLIFERIREELKSGKTVQAAINTGYSRAFTTIFDANITTLLTAIVLYQFGTGPLRGFAVTLGIGIVASMFTAIIVTRVIFDTFTSNRRLATLSI